MFRNLKALGLLVFAALAMSATFAAGAQGQTTEEFGTLTSGTTNSTTTTAHHEKTDLHGAQIGSIEENFFEAFETEIHCENSGVTYTGTSATGTTTEVTLEPTYKDCTTSTDLPVTVTMNGCQYIFTHPETIEPFGTGTYTGKAHLTCPHEASIDIEVYGSGGPTSHSGGILCTVRVHATGSPTESEGETKHVVQELGGHVVYHNGVNAATGKHDVTATATITGISVTRQGLCTFGIHQTANNGTFASKVTLTATRDVAPTGTQKETEEARDLWLSDNEV